MSTNRFAAERRDVVRLAVIEDSEFLRTGLRIALGAEEGIEVVGEFGLSDATVSEVERLRPDVVLLGMKWPNLNRSAKLCRLIRRAYPPTRVLMLSPASWDDEVLTSILSGASGLVATDVPRSELVHAIRLAVNGGTHFEEGVAERVIGRLGQNRPTAEENPDIERLSTRERVILAMLADGLNNSEIAEGLGIATATVRNNLTNIRAKLDLDSRTKLARFAYVQGLTSVVTDGLSRREGAPNVDSTPPV